MVASRAGCRNGRHADLPPDGDRARLLMVHHRALHRSTRIPRTDRANPGLPFAHRIARLDPDAIPWAWATNAVCSVVGAIAVVVISMTASFAAVCWTAVAIYGIALYGPNPVAQTLD